MTTVSSQQQFIEMVPELIQKNPEDGDLVLVFMRDKEVVVAARMDIAEVLNEPEDELYLRHNRMIREHKFDSFVSVVYMRSSDDEIVENYTDQLMRAVPCYDEFFVNDNEWHTTISRESGTVDRAINDDLVEKRAHLEKLFVSNDKTIVIDQATIDDVVADVLNNSVATADKYSQLAQKETLSDEEKVILATVYSQNSQLRDVLLYDISKMNTFQKIEMFYKFAGICRDVPSNIKAVAATIAGAAAYMYGDGMRANVAIASALVFDEDYSMARLLDAMLARGMSPTELTEALSSFTRDSLVSN